MSSWSTSDSYSTCAIVVPDTAPLYELFAEGLRSRFGQVPLTGHPRMTRPRARANNAGLSGFSVIDPAGNWVRVSRAPEPGGEPRAVDDRVEWVSSGGGPLALATENAVVLADSHGDTDQAARVLVGAVSRHVEAPVAELAAALAYLTELRARLGDHEGARRTAEDLGALTDRPGVSVQDLAVIARARQEAAEVVASGDTTDQEV